MLGPQLTAGHLEGLGERATRRGLNIDRITGSPDACRSLANATAAGLHRVVGAGRPGDRGALRSELLDLSQQLEIDVAIQDDNVYRRHRRLVAFDIDSTLIRTEVIDELATPAGVGDQVAAITERR